MLAQHEQVNILQKIMYSDWYTRQLLDANQYAVVTGILTGDADKIELTLSAQCKAKDGFTWYCRVVVLAGVIGVGAWWHYRTPEPTVLSFRIGQTLA